MTLPSLSFTTLIRIFRARERVVPVILSDIFGDPNVGIFSFANEKIAVLPAGTSAVKLASFKEALGVEAYGIGIADSRLVGIYLSGNSNSKIGRASCRERV